MSYGMYVLDMNQISIASIMVQGKQYRYVFNENLIRHIILSVLLHLSKKFKFRQNKSKVLLCYDSYSWRKDIFPQYKGNRKKDHEADIIDWSELYRILNMIRDEFDQYLPYDIIKVDDCEADDIIATLCYKFLKDKELIDKYKDFIIVSGDKDFIQLHRHNVKQYDPIHKKNFIKINKSPKDYLKEHIIRGDSSDGIPNIKSDDNTFIDASLRQKPIRQKEIDDLLSPLYPIEDQIKVIYGVDVLDRYRRNKALIDLESIPQKIKNSIIKEYIRITNKPSNRSRLLTYLVKKKLKNFIDEVQLF